MVFENRRKAGQKLADKLTGLIADDCLILAIPRGGVVVAAEVAERFGAELDLIIPRKIGSPQNPEMAIGAVTQDGTTILNQRMVDILRIGRRELNEKISDEIKEIKRRMFLYRGSDAGVAGEGRQVIVIDDGVATGYTMLAALRSVRNLLPREVILAIPLAPPDTLKMLEKEADKVLCLLSPADFYAVGQFYRDFEQTGDDQVIKILEEQKKNRENKKHASPK